MSDPLSPTSDQNSGEDSLPSEPPFIWPDARALAGFASYADKPPSRTLLSDADLIAALLVGAADHTIRWLRDLVESQEPRRICLVIVLSPAGPTREDHLRVIEAMQAANDSRLTKLDVRLLPFHDDFGADFRRPTSPPTVIAAHNSRTGQTVLTVGSTGDSGCDEAKVGSLNLVFRPEDALRDEWRRWFQYVFDSAAPLNRETCRIPRLAPAEGDPAAVMQWAAFLAVCRQGASELGRQPSVDPATGEVVANTEGPAVATWDEGRTALDPLARVFQKVYANGWLVTVDQETRIKPLTVPVKATLLGQRSERTVGPLKHRQSFSLQVLDDTVEKAIEQCRKISDIVELLSCPLSQGNRWLPDTARELLEAEIDRRNEEGKKTLESALGGSVDEFIKKRRKAIRDSLDGMYRELGQADVVPEDRFREVLADIGVRLTSALRGRIAPRAVFNRVSPPDLTTAAPDENWRQPLSLLKHSARMLRASLTDIYFPRRVTGLAFSLDRLRSACDPFGDAMAASEDVRRAKRELEEIDAIAETDNPARERAHAIWAIVKGIRPEGVQ